MERILRATLFVVMLALGFFLLSGCAGIPVRYVPSAVPDTFRMTNSGPVIGLVEDNGSHAWLGIPYARPPVGKLRWKAPQPIETWQGTRKALTSCAPCTQIGGPLGGNITKAAFGKPVGSEDCLYLNIWAPGYAPGEVPQGENRLPVMFWIHGGGNTIGQGTDYNGKVLAQTYNVLVVTINYRLGPLGWFVHPALRAESKDPESRSGNFGTLDIIQALHWVQGNIAAFGGNPDNITVFGESAGGRNTLSLMISPLAKGLFHRAVVQSGATGRRTIANGENYKDAPEPGDPFSSREIINKLLVADDSAKNLAEGRRIQEEMSEREIAAYLRDKSAYELVRQYNADAVGMLDMPRMFADGTVLPRGDILEIFSRPGNYNAVPVILGTNRNEFRLFMALNPNYTLNFLGFYPLVKDRENYLLVDRYQSAAWKIAGVDRLARVLRESQGPTVYAYRFDWDEEPRPLGVNLPLLLGAAHGFEIPFVFRNFDLGFTAGYTNSKANRQGREALSDIMSSYWAQFAYTGDPGRGRNGEAVPWRPWENGDDTEKMIIFDTPQDAGIRMSTQSMDYLSLKQKLVDECGIGDQETRCELYVRLFGDKDHFFGDTSLWDDAEYESLGCTGCRDYPKKEFLKKK